MLFLEIQRGKSGMMFAEFNEIMLKTAACAARMMKYSRKRKTRDETVRVYVSLFRTIISDIDSKQ